MRKIDKPTLKVRTVFKDCISTVDSDTLKAELTACTNLLEIAENDFDLKIRTNELYTIPQSPTILGNIGKVEMGKVYTDRMVKKDKPGRKHYDSIFLSAPGGKCPLCSQRIVTTLDHYLPKTKYPIYSVTPINLVPACTDCNKGKLVSFPTVKEEETLHPYYDDIETVSWLKANLVKTNPFGFEYYVDPPVDWSDILKERVRNHFKSFNLNYLYSFHAIEELENIKITLTRLYNNGGALLLKDHLNDCYESRKETNVNSWQTVFYESLMNDDWFCNGGLNAQ